MGQMRVRNPPARVGASCHARPAARGADKLKCSPAQLRLLRPQRVRVIQTVVRAREMQVVRSAHQAPQWEVA